MPEPSKTPQRDDLGRIVPETGLSLAVTQHYADKIRAELMYAGVEDAEIDALFQTMPEVGKTEPTRLPVSDRAVEDTAVVMGGGESERVGVSRNLRQIARHGKKSPVDVWQEAKDDPSIRDHVLSKNGSMPQAYSPEIDATLTPQQRYRAAQQGVGREELPKEPPDVEAGLKRGGAALVDMGAITLKFLAGIERGRDKGLAEVLKAVGIMDRDEVAEAERIIRSTYIFGDDSSLAAEFGEEFGRIATPAVPIYKALRLGGMGVVTAGILAESVGAALGLDPNEPNFSTVLTDMIPPEQDSVIADALREALEYAATDPENKTELQNRLANGLENTVLAGAFVAIGGTISAMVKLGGKMSENPEAVQKALETAAPPPAKPEPEPMDISAPAPRITIPHSKPLTEPRTDSKGNVVAPPVFFQRSVDAVAKAQEKTAKGERWMAILKKGGITNDELKWTGIEDWLADHKGERITKDDVQRYLELNRVEVVEVVGEETAGRAAPIRVVLQPRRGAPDRSATLIERQNTHNFPTVAEGDYQYQVMSGGRRIAATPNRDAALAIADRLRKQEGPGTKWGSYIESGDATNYREFKVVLPPAAGPKVVAHPETPGKFALQYDDGSFELYEGRIATWSDRESAEGGSRHLRNQPAHDAVVAEARRLAAGQNENWENLGPTGRQMWMDQAERNLARRNEARGGIFTGGHFSEPNVLYHVRTTDRRDDEGRRVLFLEEVQSDWLQSKMFRSEVQDSVRQARADLQKAEDELRMVFLAHAPRNSIERLESGEARLEELATQLWRGANKQYLETQPGQAPTGIFGEVNAATAGEEAFIVSNLLDQKIGAYQQADRAAYRVQSEADRAAPDAPLRDTWIRSAMRRMLRYAADNDYDAIAWTTGDQQVARWSEDYRTAYEDTYDRAMVKEADKLAKPHKAKTGSEDIGLDPPEKHGFEVVDPRSGETVQAGPFDDEDEAFDWIRENQDYDVQREIVVRDHNGQHLEHFPDDEEAEEYLESIRPFAQEIAGPFYQVVDASGAVDRILLTRGDAELVARPSQRIEEVDRSVWIVTTADGVEGAERRLMFDARRTPGEDAARPTRDDVLAHLYREAEDYGEVYDNLDQAETRALETHPFIDDESQFALYADGDHIDNFDSEEAAREYFYDHHEWTVAETGVDYDGDGSGNVHFLELPDGLKKEAREKGFPLFTTAGGVAGGAAALAGGTDEAQAQTQAPPLESEFDVAALDEQKMASLRGRLLQGLTRFQRHPSVERVIQRLSIGGKDKRPRKWDDIYTEAVDDLYPINRLIGRVEKEQGPLDLSVTDDPYRLARLNRGVNGKAEHFLEYSPFKYGTYENVGKSLKEILAPVKDDLDEFRAYAVSKRAIELHGRGIETGIDPDDARRTVGALEFRLEPIFREIVEYQDHVLAYLKDAGVLSDDAVATMRAANQDYVPFFRLMEDKPKQGGLGRGFGVWNPVKKIKGSEREIIDPLESIIKNTYAMINIADRNGIADSLWRLAETTGDESIAKLVAPPMQVTNVTVDEARKASPEMAQILDLYSQQTGVDLKAEDFTVFRPNPIRVAHNQVVVYRDGKRHLLEVDEDIADTFMALDRESSGALVRILGAPARLLRAGAVLSPEFVARNPIRDQLSAMVFSQKGFIPFLDLSRGIYSMVRRDDLYQDWLKSGGPMASLVSMDRRYLQKNIREIAGETSLGQKVVNVVTSPIEALRILSDLSERGTRLGEFGRVAGRGSQRSREDILRGGMASREVTLDFNRIGAKTRSVNQIIAFWNASVQGHDKLIRSFREHPTRTSAKIAAGITLPSVTLQYINRTFHDDPDDPNRFSEIPQWQRDLFWLVRVDDTWWRIPKPFELGIIFGSGAERVVDSILEKDPKAFDGFLEGVGRGAMPGFLPTVVQAPMEQWANKSFFTDRPIIPASREKMLPEYQYSGYTTETAKALGSLIGQVPAVGETTAASPAMIENYIRSWSGGLGMHILNLTDLALRKSGVVPDPVRPTKTLADIPFVKGFVVRHPSSGAESVVKFYKEFDKQQAYHNTYNTLLREGEFDEAMKVLDKTIAEGRMLQLPGIRQSLGTLSGVIGNIYRNPAITPDEKRQLIDATYYQMIEIAKAGVGLIEAGKEQAKAEAELHRQLGFPPVPPDVIPFPP